MAGHPQSRPRRLARLLFATAVAAGAGVAATPGATPGFSTSGYVVSATAVVRPGNIVSPGVNPNVVVDEGGVVCEGITGTGIGGGCLGNPAGNLVQVNDVLSGKNVAFQVCSDNDGDGLCQSPDSGPCADATTFSHGDVLFGYANPLQAPPGPPTGCPGPKGFHGYVVFICTGVHNDPHAGPHAHPALAGTIDVVGTGFTPSGNFCGGTPVVQSVKPYVVLP